jgi:hypothetical protein
MDVNPVLIKEWRQASHLLQGLTVTLLLALLLASSLCLELMNHEELWTIEHSPSLLLATLVGLIITGGLLAVTLDIHTRTRDEWRPSVRDLIFTTSLTPRRMVVGKFLACLSLNGFVLSLAVPHLLLATRCQGVHKFHCVTHGEILQGMATLCLLALLIQGAAVAASVVDLPRPVMLLAGGYLFAFIGWRPLSLLIFFTPDLFISLQLFLAGHVLLVWLVASFGLLAPAAARRSRRLFLGVPLVIGLAINDLEFYDSCPASLQKMLLPIMVLAAFGYLGTLALLGWIYWRRRMPEASASQENSDRWTARCKYWLEHLAMKTAAPPAIQPEPSWKSGTAESRSAAPAEPLLVGETPWLPRLDRPPASSAEGPPLPTWGDFREGNPVFIKVARSLVRQKFFILLPAVAIVFMLASVALYQIFTYMLADEWPLYHFFFRTFLMLSLMLFWSMSYEIVYRTLEEWSGKDAATDPIRLSPLGGYRILAWLLLIGLLAMPLPWLATIPNLWFAGLLKGWSPDFWPSIAVLALAAFAIYLWTLAVAFWDASRLFKTFFSFILFCGLFPRTTLLARILEWDHAGYVVLLLGYAVLFAGMAASALVTPWRRRWWPPLLHFIAGAALLGWRGHLNGSEFAAGLQIAVFAAAYLQLLLGHRWR